MKFKRVVGYLLVCAAVGCVLQFLVIVLGRGRTSIGGERLAFLLLVREFVDNGEVWEAWIKDALDWTGSGNSDKFHFFIHHDVGADPGLVWNSVPKGMQPFATLASHPRKCRHMQTTPCMFGALEESFNHPVDYDFFAFVSSDAIPVKPLRWMLGEFRGNGRSRFAIARFNWPASAKHHQWIVLNRKHATMLVQHEELWTKFCSGLGEKFREKGGGKLAADDEFCPLNALRVLTEFPDADLRDSTAAKLLLMPKERADRYDRPRVASLWREINEGVVPPPAEFSYEESFFDKGKKMMFVCWKWCKFVGRCRPPHRPCTFRSLYSSFMTNEVIHGEYLFFRKATNATYIDKGESLSEFMAFSYKESFEGPQVGTGSYDKTPFC